MSLFITVAKDLNTEKWIIYLDYLSTPLHASLSFNLVNTTSLALNVSILGDNSFDHKLSLSDALPRLHPHGGKLRLVPQFSLDRLIGLTLPRCGAKYQSASEAAPFPCKFLADEENLSLKFHYNSDFTVMRLIDCEKNEGCPVAVGGVVFFVKLFRSDHLLDVAIYSLQPPSMDVHTLQAPLISPAFSISIDLFSIACLSPLTTEEDSASFLRLSIRRLSLDMSKDQCFQLTSSLIQLDNLAQKSAAAFDFPVLLRFALSRSNCAKFSLTGQVIHGFILSSVNLQLPFVEAYIDDNAIYAIASWLQDLKCSLPEYNKMSTQPNLVLCAIRGLQIQPVTLQVAVKMSFGIHISCRSTSLQLSAYNLPLVGCVQPVETLFAQLAAHYLSQALMRAGLVLGGLELIGNPAGLVASFAAGVWDLVHFADAEEAGESSKGIRRVGIIRGLAGGLASLVKHTTG